MPRNQTSPVVIRAARMVDGSGAALARDAAVWLDRGRIAYAGPAAGLPAAAAAAGARTLDLPGATVLPGLIDVHVHLVASGGADFKAAIVGASPAALTVTAVDNARRHLAAGTTLVRDLGATRDEAVVLGRAVEAGTIAGPRVVAAGRAVTMTGGHIDYLGRVADGPEQMRLAVRENLALGATCIKVVATGGVLSPGIDPSQPSYDQQELDALVSEAHRHGLTVAAHAIGLDGVATALRAGVDSIEHGMFLDDTTIELLCQTGARLVPTFSALRGVLDGDAPEWNKARARPAGEAQAESFAKALAAGVRVAAGTDAGTPGNPHGRVDGELAFMVAAGLDPLRAIAAATGDAADLLGVADRGRLTEGAAADVLVVDGDPVADIAAVQRVMHVFQDGVEVTHPPRV